MWALGAFRLWLQPSQPSPVTCWPAEPDFRARGGRCRTRDVDRGVTCGQYGSFSEVVLLPPPGGGRLQSCTFPGAGLALRRTFLGSGGHVGAVQPEYPLPDGRVLALAPSEATLPPAGLDLQRGALVGGDSCQSIQRVSL